MEKKFELNEWTLPLLCEEHITSRTVDHSTASSAPKQAGSGKENVKTTKKRKQGNSTAGSAPKQAGSGKENTKTAKKRKQASEGKNVPKRRKAKGIVLFHTDSTAYAFTITSTFHVELLFTYLLTCRS